LCRRFDPGPHHTLAPINSGLLYYMHFEYVFHSPSAGRYYIGETVSVEERLAQHRDHH